MKKWRSINYNRYRYKNILNSRIVAKQTNFNGLVEDYIRTLITDSIINPTNKERKIENFVLADKVGFKETIREQVTYDYVGTKIQELCQNYEWGYKIVIKDRKFVFFYIKGKIEVIMFNFHKTMITYLQRIIPKMIAI